jgi:hypothetical protein
MDRLTRAHWIAAAMCAVPTAGALAWLAMLAIAGVTGHHPIWSDEPASLSEAAAFRDGGDVVRRVARGEDLNAQGRVRAGFVSDDEAMMAPIEAAAASRDWEMVQLLYDLGASPDAPTWQRAWCATGEDDVREVLTARRPDNADDRCDDAR